jgi:hypothetical protein
MGSSFPSVSPWELSSSKVNSPGFSFFPSPFLGNLALFVLFCFVLFCFSETDSNPELTILMPLPP